MFKIIGIDKFSRVKLTIELVKSEGEAEHFCEQWGWIYDDGIQSYWLGYQEM